MIKPNKATSKRSDSIIDFGISQNASGWTSEVLDEGESDHWPVLFQSCLAINEDSFFKKTNWRIYNYFLTMVYEYWLSVVYNIDEQTFFSLFSSFLSALSDRCSVYETVAKYRPPWPPDLVLLAKSVNRARRAYRRMKCLQRLQLYLDLKDIFIAKRTDFLNSKQEQKLKWVAEGNNVWTFVKPHFHAFTPPFRGLTIGSEKITDGNKIVETLANYFETHFKKPQHDNNNNEHVQSVEIFENIEYTPNIPLEPITVVEVLQEWKKFKKKKSLDSTGTSAFMIKQLPQEYIGIITVLFNHCAAKGEFFVDSKHAKVVCLSKDGLFPTENKLRPISLLPNLGKWFERIIHKRILKWCENNNIFVDEQSGFTANRRLQTRIVSLIEDIRLTIAACNRPALAIFVDFMSAFDRMWFCALISSLTRLDMPLAYIKWISSWISNRTISIHYGDYVSRTIKMEVGAPQGSILAATLFRLHIHHLPSFFHQVISHLFADDLALILSGSLENKFSLNVVELEERANKAMLILEKFADDHILPVNIQKTKAVLIHNIVSPSLPKIKFKDKNIDYVTSFQYLGVTITTKLGWGKYIDDKLRKIKGTYNAMKVLFYNIPKKEILIRLGWSRKQGMSSLVVASESSEASIS
ncbi:unnamed protein product [Adineta steineri]|uniref:Reverse transcriptase domain-containing protein n=1 Tax=Adineta steineri TaxID=433720 RepID=A0A815S035_9BILA|nr:unnamed protein product [Adineta steineri]CAF1483118.1 unnamed protein product [Adineta steineri]